MTIPATLDAVLLGSRHRGAVGDAARKCIDASAWSDCPDCCRSHRSPHWRRLCSQATDRRSRSATAAFALTFTLDRPGAMLLGVAALLWTFSGRYAAQDLRDRPNQGGFVVCWLMTLTGCVGVFLAADLIGFYFLLAVLSVGASGLVLQGNGAKASACRRRLSRSRAAGRSISARGPRAACSGHAQRQPADQRRNAGARHFAYTRSDAHVIAHRPRHEGGIGAAAFLDAACVQCRAHSGRCSDERRRGEGERARAHPFPAARCRVARLRIAARNDRDVRCALRRCGRNHAIGSEDRACVFQRESDGFRRGGHRYGSGRRGRRHRDWLQRSMRFTTCWSRAACSWRSV